MKKIIAIIMILCFGLTNFLYAQESQYNTSNHLKNEEIIKDISATLLKLKSPEENQKFEVLNEIKKYLKLNKSTDSLTNIENAIRSSLSPAQNTPSWIISLSNRWKLMINEKDAETMNQWTSIIHSRITHLSFENIIFQVGPDIGPFEQAYINVRFSSGQEDDVLNIRLHDTQFNQSFWIVENVLLYPQAEVEGLSLLFSMEGISPVEDRYRFEIKLGKSDEPNKNFRPDLTVSLSPQTFIYHVPLLRTENDQFTSISFEEKEKDKKEKAKPPKETKTNHSRIEQMPNEDLNAKATPSDNMACGPAAAANSLDWLNKYDKNLKGKIPDDRRKLLEKLKRYMARNDSFGVRFDSFVSGKLAIIDELQLPIHVKYQTKHDSSGNLKEINSRFGNNQAENKGSVGKEPDWEWFKSEMDKGEDVEVQVGYYEVIKVPLKKGSKKTKDSLVRIGGHWLVATGYTDHKNGRKHIHTKDDQDQAKKGGTKKGQHLLEDFNGKTEFKPRSKKIITLWESTVSESFDSTINQKDPVGMKKDFTPYAVVPFPWTVIEINEESMKPDYPFTVLKKTKFPWIWIGTGVVGAGVLTWVLTRDKETSPVDTTPVAEPIARCKDVVKFLDPDGMSTLFLSDIDAGSSSGVAITQYHYSPSILNCNQLGTIHVRLTITDARDRKSSCTSIVMVRDGIAPIPNCRDLQREIGPNGDYQLIESDFEGMMEDNCKRISLLFHPTLVQCQQGLVHPLTLAGVDASGNQSYCSISLQLIDRIAPVVQCVKSHTVDLNQNGTAEILTSSLIVSSSDNCGKPNVTQTNLSFHCNETGNRQQILTVTDESGNTSSCQVDIHIRDLIPPSLQCPSMHMALLDQNGRFFAMAQDLVSSANDNCGIQNYAPSTFDFSCADIGEKQINISVTDLSGNTASCQILLQIKDQNPPTLSCQNMAMIPLDETGTSTIQSDQLLLNLTDNCGIRSLTPVQNNFSCLDLGNHTIPLLATDVSGNTSSCEVQIEVKDLIPPVLACNSAVVTLGNGGKYTLVESDVVSGKTDNCGTVNISFSKTEFDCNDIGENSIIVTATDGSGNTSICATNVLVTGDSELQAKCKDKKLNLDSMGKAVLLLSDIDSGSGGGCLPFSLSYDRNNFNCSDTGMQQVILIATDSDGNTSSCTSLIMVVDQIAPHITCQDVVVSLDANGRAGIVIQEAVTSQWDNCKIVKIEFSKSSFNCNDLGSRTVQLTATDVFGNTGTCQIQVEVIDEIPPIARCRNIELLILNPTGPPTKVNPSQVDAGSTDNCSIVSRTLEPDEFTFENIGPNLVTLTVYDAAGNSGTCIAVITVVPGIKGEDPDGTSKNSHGANDPYVLGDHQKKKNKWFVFFENLMRCLRFYPVECPDCK